jgi:hypothetical protein
MKAEELEKNLVEASENGHTISPVLAEGIKNYLIEYIIFILNKLKNGSKCIIMPHRMHLGS